MTTQSLPVRACGRNTFLRTAILLLGLSFVAAPGCARTSVKSIPLRSSGPAAAQTNTTVTPAAPLAKPEYILVHDFAVTADEVALDRAIGAQLLQRLQGDSQNEEQLKVGRATAQALAIELVKAIQKLGLTAKRAMEAKQHTGTTLAIEGQFVSIDEGNRLRRMVIGLGAGATEVKTQVQVYNVTSASRTLLQQFETTAQSSRKPGMAETMGVGAAVRGAQAVAIGAGVGVASEYGQTVEADAQRTAQAIADQLKPFFLNEGWIAR